MFVEDGLFAKNFATLGFACSQCHHAKDGQRGARYAKAVHSLGK